MTGYGPPPGPPAPPPPPPRAPMTAERQAQVLGYSAGAAGILSFIWGFLDWYNGGTGGYSILGGGASAAVSLTLVAGLIAAARAFERKPLGVEPAAIAVAGLLIVFGVLIGKSSSDTFGGGSTGTEVGQILQLITAIIQAALLVYAWLAATGRLPAPRPHQPPPPGQWQQQGPPPGYQQPPPPTQQFQQPPQGYQSPPPGYQPPQQ